MEPVGSIFKRALARTSTAIEACKRRRNFCVSMLCFFCHSRAAHQDALGALESEGCPHRNHLPGGNHAKYARENVSDVTDLAGVEGEEEHDNLIHYWRVHLVWLRRRWYEHIEKGEVRERIDGWI